MKRISVFLAAVLMTVCAFAQTQELFKPYKTTALRLPSVPLLTSDPYFSIWSPYDRLTDGPTTHWTPAVKPVNGYLRVDGKLYRFMGARQVLLESIAPMASEETWSGKVRFSAPGDGWEKPAYDDAGWETKQAAFGSDNLNFVHTSWSKENSDLYVRRTVNLSAADLQGDLYMVYSHDDVFELYINGTKVADTGETWVDNVQLPLGDSLKALLHEGKNVIAAHCHNTTGGAYTDFGLFRNTSPEDKNVATAVQKAVDVMPTSTYYTLACGPVDVDLVFTAPALIDDYDLLSSPVNYISYQVRSTDGKAHSVQLMLTSTPQMAVNDNNQPTISTTITEKGMTYLKAGTIEQPILAKKGDGICIDWGYFYMPACNGEVSLGSAKSIMQSFAESGKLPASEQQIVCRKAGSMPLMSYVHDFGSTTQASCFTMMGYDEIEDIEYMYRRYRAYWAHEGKVSIFDMFGRMQREYPAIMSKCRALDQRLYDDAMKAGGVKYAEILSGSYRHVIAAHKLFKDYEGNLLFFSKENNSNGCVNTVDLTYPSAPLFLLYNPDLQKGMITSILNYSKSGRWTKPFAAHDLGTYPIANGQVYGGDMPLEEAGNILTLVAQIGLQEGNASYAAPYIDILRTWADYLAANGQDPANQLCTDDFAGHWAHNCNLSLKAIMGVAAFGKIAALQGDKATSDKYLAKAREMAAKWEKDALEGDHYKLAFDRSGTWSQKYNIVWDKLWGTKLFSDKVMEREIAYYLKHQNKYGLPLDCRKDYTKNDWIMWTASMSPNDKTFRKFIDPIYDYVNETKSRVPISDWYDTKTGLMVGFKARSVIGGFWMKELMDRMTATKK